jgi:hypothetical protein
MEKKMEENNERFDSLIREKLVGYEPEVPHAIWNRISADLGSETEACSTSLHIEPVRRSYTIWAALAIAAVTVIAVGIAILMQPTASTTAATATVAPPHSTTPAPAIEPSTATITSIETPSQQVAISVPAINHASKDAHVETASPATHIAMTTQKEIQLPTTNPAFDVQAVLSVENEKEAIAQNNTIELGNVQLYNLNLMSKRPINDEITVIKSISTSKKKHGKNKDQEETKVILLGKKYDRMPDIMYQMPIRF